MSYTQSVVLTALSKGYWFEVSLCVCTHNHVRKYTYTKYMYKETKT